MWHSLTAISLPLGWLFLPSPRLWLLSRPPRCQIPWPFWVLWQPAPGTLLSIAFNIRNWLATCHFCLLVEKMTRKCMKIWDLHNPCILGQELETTKAGPPNQKDVFPHSKKICACAPNEDLQKQKTKPVLGIWRGYVRMSSWHEDTKVAKGWNDIKISNSSPSPHPFEIASFPTFCHENSEVQTILNPQWVQEKQHPQSSASSFKVSLPQEDQRDGMGCFEGLGVLISSDSAIEPLLQKLLSSKKRQVQKSPMARHCKAQTQKVESAPTAPAL